MPTEQQIENLRMAYSIMAGVPAEKVYLNVIRKDLDRMTVTVSKRDLIHKCGTVGCIAGWLSAHPYFTSQGLRFSFALDLEAQSERLFGVSHIFDAGTYLGWGKAKAMERLREALFDAGAITLARYYELAAEEAALTA